MAKVFISYYRGDSPYAAHLIHDRLTEEFGADAIFIDVVGIPPGVPFQRHLEATLDQCSVLLAIIGRHWLDPDPGDKLPRLHKQGDFVHLEIKMALDKGIPVIPVIVDGQGVPREEELPDDLKEIAGHNVREVRSGNDLHSDLDMLVAAVEPYLPAETLRFLDHDFLLIKPSEFLMGSPETDTNAGTNELPQHSVNITRPFYLGVYPVTQRQYRNFLGKGPNEVECHRALENRPLVGTSKLTSLVGG